MRGERGKEKRGKGGQQREQREHGVLFRLGARVSSPNTGTERSFPSRIAVVRYSTRHRHSCCGKSHERAASGPERVASTNSSSRPRSYRNGRVDGVVTHTGPARNHRGPLGPHRHSLTKRSRDNTAAGIRETAGSFCDPLPALFSLL